MFSDSGVCADLWFLLMPNKISLLSLVSCVAVILITTFAGYLIFFKKRVNAQIKETTFAKLLARNLVGALLSQYLAVIVCCGLEVLAIRAGIDSLGSLDTLSGHDLLLNQIAGITIIVLSVVFTFLANYLIAFKRIKHNTKKRLFVSLFFAAANGGILFPIYMFLSHLYLSSYW
jgi:hypothetical protein